MSAQQRVDFVRSSIAAFILRAVYLSVGTKARQNVFMLKIANIIAFAFISAIAAALGITCGLYASGLF